jgi:hypothetical protein
MRNRIWFEWNFFFKEIMQEYTYSYELLSDRKAKIYLILGKHEFGLRQNKLLTGH